MANEIIGEFFRENEARETFPKTFSRLHEKLNPQTAMQIVKVKCPSGFVFEFYQPTFFGLLVEGELPEFFAGEILASWKEQGVSYLSKDSESENESESLTDRISKIRKRTIELSHKPKIVIGEPKAGEVYINDIAKDDLFLLLKWVYSGGSSVMQMESFLKDNKKVFWLAKTAQRFNCRPSEFAKLSNRFDEITCGEFDLLCDLRLGIYEQKKEIDDANLAWYVTNRAFIGEAIELGGEDQIEDSTDDELAVLESKIARYHQSKPEYSTDISI